MKIKLLPDSVANQIAAGEVVGDPSTVVKEMAENAIDAGATLVTVNFRDGGRELVQVIDNGEGMSAADARLAFDKHATSKISSLDDIYRLHTFGFRGEALASIAAVSQVELLTRTADDELGTRIVIEGGNFVSQDAAVAPKGSNFMVRNLFYNTPARRKFLESNDKETRKIKEQFNRVALCHPEVAFMLYKDDAPLFNLPVTNLKGRIVGLIGKAYSTRLLDVSTKTTIVSVEGYVGRPEAAKKSSGEQYLFVNGRSFRSPYLHKAIMAAYEKLIPQGLQPQYFIYLTVEPDKIDVNVHPQKTEVKFSEGMEIWQILNAAVRESLAKTGVVPLMDFEDQGEVQIPVLNNSTPRRYDEPASTVNPYYNPFAGPLATRRSSADLSDFEEPYQSSPEAVAERFDRSELEYIDDRRHVDTELDLGVDADGFKGAIPLAGGYAATSLGGRLAVVDLARARELLLFRRYMMMLRSGNSVSQALLFPERMVFSADDVALLGESYDRFTSFGFDYSIIDDNTVDILAVPSDLGMDSLSEVIYDMIDTLREGTGVPEQERKERLAAILSRSSGCKQLSAGELEAVLESLQGCRDGGTTRDGRAVVRLVEPSEIKGWFN